MTGSGRLYPLWGLFRMRLIRGLSYRGAAVAGAATQFFWGFMLINVLQAFSRAGNAPMPMDQIASYIWLQQAFLVLVVAWFRDTELVGYICSGDTAYELCRPVDLYSFWFARLAGGRVAAALLRSVPILAIAFFLPEPYGLRLPASVGAFACFVPALAMGLCLMVAVSLFAYILTMVSLNPQAGFLFVGPLVDACSGLLLPLPFMPDAFRAVVEWLPFRYCADLPLRIWSGSIPLQDLPALMALQALWLVIMVVTGRLAMGAVLRRHQIPGG